MAIQQHVDHDDITSAPSVLERWQLKLAETLLIREMANIRNEAGSSALNSLDETLVLLIEGTPDYVPVL